MAAKLLCAYCSGISLSINLRGYVSSSSLLVNLHLDTEQMLPSLLSSLLSPHSVKSLSCVFNMQVSPLFFFLLLQFFPLYLPLPLVSWVLISIVHISPLCQSRVEVFAFQMRNLYFSDMQINGRELCICISSSSSSSPSQQGEELQEAGGAWRTLLGRSRWGHPDVLGNHRCCWINVSARLSIPNPSVAVRAVQRNGSSV